MERPRALQAIALAAVCLGGLAAQLAAQSPTQYIFLIDTSGSMMGRPAGSGHAVIFPKVKDELVGYLRTVRRGDIVDIRAFDRGIHATYPLRIEADRDRAEAITRVRELQAEGEVTWVYRSILETAQVKSEEAKRPDALEIPTIFYVFTDGLDNDPQGLTMREMLERYARLRQENDYLIYVTLGVELPEDDRRALEQDPHAEHYDAPRDVIRIGSIQVRARRLEFGYVEGDVSPHRSLALQLDNLDESEVDLRLVPRFPEVEAVGGVVEVEPSTVDFASSQDVRLKLINRDSLPQGTYRGEIFLSTAQPHVRVIPGRIEAAFHTTPGPAAKVTLDQRGRSLEFGRHVLERDRIPAITAKVELNESALLEAAGLYVSIEPRQKGGPAPAVVWNGEPVGEGLLWSEKRFNELVVSWPAPPTAPGDYWGEIRLVPERLALEGEALTAVEGEDSYAIPYRLELREPPAPAWVRWLLWLLGLLVLLAILALVYRLLARIWPWEAVRRGLLRSGIAKARLSGKLVYDVPGGERLELVLEGSQAIQVGRGTERWSELPDRFEIRPRYSKNREVTTVIGIEGDLQFEANNALGREPLAGQNLSHGDSLVLSDGGTIVYLDFDRR